MSLTYQDGIEGADRVEIGVANPELRWLNDSMLRVDNQLSLAIGYAPDPLNEVFLGEVTGVNASFPSGGIPTLTVVAHDFLQRLTKGSKERAFKLSIPCVGDFPLPDPIVATIVSGTNLLIPALDPIGAALSFLTFLISFAVDPLEARRAVRVQRGQSDFEFLSGIARENGWEMYIDHSLEPKGYVLRFKFLIQDYAPSVSLKWGESLMDFTPRLTTVGQVVGVSTCLWLPTIKTEFTIVLSWDYDRAAFDLKVFPGGGDLEMLLGAAQTEAVLHINTLSLASAPKKILGELLPRLNNRLTGSGTAVGDPAIKAGAVVHLDGLGQEFSGLYRVTSARHTIDSGGYRTSFDARKEVWFGSLPTPRGVDGLVRVQGQPVG
jgi:hypothetical protein